LSKHDIATAAARAFQTNGEVVSIAAYGSGHIHDTFCVTCFAENRPARFILQRINTAIFKDPVAVMQNIERVTVHLATRVSADTLLTSDRDRRVLTLIPSRSECSWHVDEHGNYWRTYRFIERARSYETVESPAQAFQAARAFGRFQQMLADLPPSELHATIPDFHHTPKRFAALELAIAADKANRATGAKTEIDFALAHRPIAGALVGANLPERVTHNDTKLNNVLFDESTGEAICVIDLDTVMPGLAAYDFGDQVRTTSSPASEDEQDLSKVSMRLPVFEALARGYLDAAAGFLTQNEKDHLAVAGKVITFEQGIRFLSDFLSGDPYYKVFRPGHNLDRCRTQFKLVESIEQQEEEMFRLVESIG
jgi:hypothetical protein